MRKYVAEFLGTMILALTAFLSGGNPYVMGATLAGLIMVGARYSGAHFNPAVTIAKAVSGSVPLDRVGLFVGAQVAGAVVGYYVFRLSQKF